jgi:hypothetical protein
VKNRHGVDVLPGQVWFLPSHGVKATVVRVYPFYKGYCVTLRHEPVWGHVETDLPLSAFMNLPNSRKSPRLHRPGRLKGKHMNEIACKTDAEYIAALEAKLIEAGIPLPPNEPRTSENDSID